MSDNNKKRVLITGVSGMLGSNLAYCWKNKYSLFGLYNSHPVKIPGIITRGMDICEKSDVQKVVDEFSPDVILHCAAIAAPEICEQKPELAEKVNVGATKNIATAIKGRDIKLVYVSSDLVYDGKKGDYVETDNVNPINWYGKTKLAGEEEALEHEDSLILRTSFFGWDIQDKARSLAGWFFNELEQKHHISGFTDVVFTCLYTFDWAKLMDLALEKNLKGIYHFASSSRLSKYDFGVELAKLCHLDHTLITPISVDDFSYKAKRAHKINMITKKLSEDLSCEIPSLRETLKSFCGDINTGVQEELYSFSSVTINS